MNDANTGNFDGAEFREPAPIAPPVYGSSLPPAPPTVAGALVKPARAVVWPVPIGIIATVFGVCGVLLSLYSAAVPWLMSSMPAWTMNTPGTTAQVDLLAGVRHWAVSTTVVHSIGVPIAAMLLAGGIGLLMRRGWSATLLIWWAILRLPMAFAVTVVTVGMQQEQVAAMSGQSGAAIGAAFVSGFMWFGAIFLIAWYCALPTFMLIWLTRPGVRRTVDVWRVGRAAEPGPPAIHQSFGPRP